MNTEKLPRLHPVVRVLEQQSPAIERFVAGYPREDTGMQPGYTRTHFGFLIDSLAQTQYTLGPKGLINIWEWVLRPDMFPVIKTVENPWYDILVSPRYYLSAMLTTTYATQGTENPAWRSFPQTYLESHQLPPEVTRDRAGLRHVLARMRRVSTHLRTVSQMAQQRPESDPIKEINSQLQENFNNGHSLVIRYLLEPAFQRLRV